MEGNPGDLDDESQSNGSRLPSLGLSRGRVSRLLWSFGVFLITSIILFIIFGEPSAFVAGYIHAVLYNHRKKTKADLHRLTQ